jgi:hypothetical protein
MWILSDSKRQRNGNPKSVKDATWIGISLWHELSLHMKYPKCTNCTKISWFVRSLM